MTPECPCQVTQQSVLEGQGRRGHRDTKCVSRESPPGGRRPPAPSSQQPEPAGSDGDSPGPLGSLVSGVATGPHRPHRTYWAPSSTRTTPISCHLTPPAPGDGSRSQRPGLPCSHREAWHSGPAGTPALRKSSSALAAPRMGPTLPGRIGVFLHGSSHTNPANLSRPPGESICWTLAPSLLSSPQSRAQLGAARVPRTSRGRPPPPAGAVD